MKHSATRALCVLSAVFLPVAGLCDPNNFTGSCDALKAYVQNFGVQSPSGQYQPGAVGITVDEIGIAGGVATYTNKKRIKSTSSYLQCYTAVAHVKFTFKVASSQLNWPPTPAACDTGACSTELSLWQNYVAAHEADHRAVDESYNHALQTTFANFPVEGCVDVLAFRGNQSVSQAIAEGFDATIRAKVRDLRGKRDTDNGLIDAIAPKDDALPNCSACAPCPCPAGQILFGSQCVNSPCGPITSQEVFQNCGASAAKQPVACCTINGNLACSPCRDSTCPDATTGKCQNP